MELTVYAAWLNEVFSLFDSFVLGLCHELAVAYGNVLNDVIHVIDELGHYGVVFIALGIILLFFRKTRMTGVAIIISIGIAGVLSEFIIKDFVDRPRPFMSSDTFKAWWQFVGSPDAHSSSFPSGHVAAATAAMIAVAYGARRWYVSLLGVIVIAVMMLDRMYLMVHYPSDVLAGFILGFICGIIGYAIAQGIWRLMGKHPDQIADAKAVASRHAALEAQRGRVPAGAQGAYGAQGARPGYPAGAQGACPGQPGRPGQPGQPARPGQPASQQRPGQPAPQAAAGRQSARSAAQPGAAAPAAPTREPAPRGTSEQDSATRVMPRVPSNQADQPAQAGQPTQPNQPTQPSQPARPGQPGGRPGAYTAAVEKPDVDENFTLEDLRNKDR